VRLVRENSWVCGFTEGLVSVAASFVLPYRQDQQAYDFGNGVQWKRGREKEGPDKEKESQQAKVAYGMSDLQVRSHSDFPRPFSVEINRL